MLLLLYAYRLHTWHYYYKSIPHLLTCSTQLHMHASCTSNTNSIVFAEMQPASTIFWYVASIPANLRQIDQYKDCRNRQHSAKLSVANGCLYLLYFRYVLRCQCIRSYSHTWEPHHTPDFHHSSFKISSEKRAIAMCIHHQYVQVKSMP